MRLGLRMLMFLHELTCSTKKIDLKISLFGRLLAVRTFISSIWRPNWANVQVHFLVLFETTQPIFNSQQTFKLQLSSSWNTFNLGKTFVELSISNIWNRFNFKLWIGLLNLTNQFFLDVVVSDYDIGRLNSICTFWFNSHVVIHSRLYSKMSRNPNLDGIIEYERQNWIRTRMSEKHPFQVLGPQGQRRRQNNWRVGVPWWSRWREGRRRSYSSSTAWLYYCDGSVPLTPFISCINTVKSIPYSTSQAHGSSHCAPPEICRGPYRYMFWPLKVDWLPSVSHLPTRAGQQSQKYFPDFSRLDPFNSGPD